MIAVIILAAMFESPCKDDTGLLIAVPDYEQRKRNLEWYKLKWEQSKIKALTA